MTDQPAGVRLGRGAGLPPPLAERAGAYNKQAKPVHYVFGNLVAARASALLEGAGFFAEPSVAVEISPPYDFDLDAPGDTAVAEALLAAGAVRLPHITGTPVSLPVTR